MVNVKICGITKIEDALAAAEFGADMIGFNFYEKSPRYIDPQTVKEIDKKLQDKGNVKTFGVFVNKELDEVVRIATYTNIDVIQLHGDESPFYFEQLEIFSGISIVKAFRKNDELAFGKIDEYETQRDSELFNMKGILVDAYSKDLYGGSGEITDWNFAKMLVDLDCRLYLAGGLTPENVADAVRTVRPFAVDVASGVEVSPGIKDHKKMLNFIRNAKNA